MKEEDSTKVAILLATHNSANFIVQQITSLRENTIPFTLHWLDDHSTDNTREVVLALASTLSITLKTWHQPDFLGVPHSFFRLLECVTADIYLFCDHDDIWQPGKIDVTVRDLLPDLDRPTLCFSEPLVFLDARPGKLNPYFKLIEISAENAQLCSKAFVINPAVGNTIGFTRPLREVFLSLREIAGTHAIMHDWWLRLLALACGTSRLLRGVPTTLYRQHSGNAMGVRLGARSRTLASMWRQQQRQRLAIARQAAGFLIASEHLSRGAYTEQLTASARLIKSLDERLGPFQIATLVREGAMPLPLRRALLLTAVSALSAAAK